MYLRTSKTTSPYRPGIDRKSAYKSVWQRHWRDFREVYPESFSHRHGELTADKIFKVSKILSCGDYRNGFRKHACPECGTVLMVLGNHDHWAGTRLSLKYLNESGRSIRYNSSYVRRGTAKIAIAGAGDNWSEQSGIDEALKNIDDDVFRIVLAHNPDTTDEHRAARVDLFISGHTQSSQIIIPCLDNSFLIPIKNKKYTRGFKKNKKGEKIFISTGLGWSVAPFRFNCLPELSILQLHRRE